MDPATLSTAAPALVQLVRAGLVGHLTDGAPSQDSLAQVLQQISQLAKASGDLSLQQLLDWWSLAYTGTPIDGSFFTHEAVPSSVRHALEGYLNPPRTLTRLAIARVHESRLAHLKSLGDHVTPTSRRVFEALVVESIADATRRLTDDPNADLADILDKDAEDLAAKADPDRSVPRNGLRWPGFVARAREVQEGIRAYAASARALAALPEQDVIPAGCSDPAYAEIFAALTLDARSPAEHGVLDGLLQEAPQHDAVARRCLVAFLTQLEIVRPWIAADWDAIQSEGDPIRSELHDLAAALPEPRNTAIDEVESCLKWGLTNDAEVWLAEIRAASHLHTLRGRHEMLARALVDVSDPATAAQLTALLRSLDDLIGRGDFVGAQLVADGAELTLGHTARRDSSDLPLGSKRSQGDAPRSPAAEDNPAIATALELGADSSKEEIRAAARSGRGTELITLADAMTATGSRWFWDIIASDIGSDQKSAVWGAVRPAFFRAVEADPGLEGLLAPPSPTGSIHSTLLEPRMRTLTVWLPKREFTPASMNILGSVARCLESRDIEGAAREFLSAAERGWRPGYSQSIACWMEIGRPDAALRAYRRFLDDLPTTFITPTIAWNIAAAYEQLGDDGRASMALRYFLRVRPKASDESQQQMIESFGRRAHQTFDFNQRPPVPPQQASGQSMSDSQREVKRAREEYASGSEEQAERRLERLLEREPRSPGAFLLLRIHREKLRRTDAEALIRRLDARGAATWKHFLELARIDLDCGQPLAALTALSRALELEPTATSKADYLDLQTRAERQAGEEARSMAALGGSELSLQVVNRLARGGNLDREDWERASRRHISNGEIAHVLEVTESVADREAWVISSVIETIIDLDVGLDDADVRLRLIDMGVQAPAPVVEALADHLQKMASLDDTTATDVLTDVMRLLEEARRLASPRNALRFAWHMVKVLDRLGRQAESAALAREALPPRPISKVGSPNSLLPQIEPVLPVLTTPRNARDTLTAAISASTEDRRPGTSVADAWIIALDDGSPIAASTALAWLILEGRSPEAIEAYQRHEDHLYLSASLTWNVAAALAQLGQYELAASWFTICTKISDRDPSVNQRRARDALFRHIGLIPPAGRATNDLPIATGPLSEVEFGHGVRLLRDRVASGVMSHDEAYRHGHSLHARLINPRQARASWAVLLHETNRSAESFDVLKAMYEDGAWIGTTVNLAVNIAISVGHEGEALDMVRALPQTHVTLFAQAKLHLALEDERTAKLLAEESLRLSPTYDEASHFLNALIGGRSPLREAPLPQCHVIYCGLTKAGATELLLSFEPRAPLHDLRCETATREIALGDLSRGSAGSRVAFLLEPEERSTQLTFTYVEDSGRTRQFVVPVPKPSSPVPAALPFDPTQPAPDQLFVGRAVDIEVIESHYKQRQQIIFLGGPRQVGKTSLVRRCCTRARERNQGLLFAIMEGDGYRGSSSFLEQLAETIDSEIIARGHDPSPDRASTIPGIPQFKQWFRGRVVPILDGADLVVAIDEVQVMLDCLAEPGGEDTLGGVAGLVRSMNADHDLPMKFLLLGSCTYASVRDRLAATNVAAELSEKLVGFLDYHETVELLARGFRTTGTAFHVLPSAHDAFWALTAGYPNHVHLLARMVGDLMEERGERVIQAESVYQAGDALVRQDRVVVEHLLGRERERDYQQQVLMALAEFYGRDESEASAVVDPTELDLVERLGPEYADGVDRFLRLGLLRKSSHGTVSVANGLINRWLVENLTRLELRVASAKKQGDIADLLEAGYTLNGAPDSDALGEFVPLHREKRYYRARRLTSSVDPANLTLTFEDEVSSPVGELVDVVGRWLILTHAHGRSLADNVAYAATNWERRDTMRVVRSVRGAAAILAEHVGCHGNLDASRIIEGASGVFIADFVFGSSQQLTTFRPSPLRPPEQAERARLHQGFGSTDDVFALGAILHHTLDLNSGYPYKPGHDLCADTTQPASDFDQMGVDESLRRIVSAMYLPDPEERMEMATVRDTLTQWLNQFQ
ncbi:hypothetical protein ASE12_10910 [Aeromicrobium sp. Root236]|nr:hypothetical protein ASE12_10910 [Aeromicrobium sp. Root236]